MSEKRFTIAVDENRDVRILDNGLDIGQFRLCNLLNELHEENKSYKIKIEDLEDSMFSEKDSADYLQAYHQGKIENVKR